MLAVVIKPSIGGWLRVTTVHEADSTPGCDLGRDPASSNRWRDTSTLRRLRRRIYNVRSPPPRTAGMSLAQQNKPNSQPHLKTTLYPEKNYLG